MGVGGSLPTLGRADRGVMGKLWLLGKARRKAAWENSAHKALGQGSPCLWADGPGPPSQ